MYKLFGILYFFFSFTFFFKLNTNTDKCNELPLILTAGIITTPLRGYEAYLLPGPNISSLSDNLHRPGRSAPVRIHKDSVSIDQQTGSEIRQYMFV